MTCYSRQGLVDNSGTAGQIICIDLHRLPELNYGFGFDVVLLSNDKPIPIIANVKRNLEGVELNVCHSECYATRYQRVSVKSSIDYTDQMPVCRASSYFSNQISQYGGQNKIQDGDHLIEISGIPVKMLSLNEIEKLLRCSGSRVLIKVQRPHDLSISRKTTSTESQFFDCINKLDQMNKFNDDCQECLRSDYMQCSNHCRGQHENNTSLSTFYEDKEDNLVSSEDSDTVPDELVEAAKRLANRLYNLDGFKAGDVAFEICKSNRFSNAVADQYMQRFDLSSMNLDTALRTMLLHFTLPGSIAENDPVKYELSVTNREKVINLFATRYIQCNPAAFDGSIDACYILTCSLLLLNTDLHGFQNHQHSIRHKKMSLSDFRKNLKATEWGGKFDNEVLRLLYNSIKHDPLRTLDPSLDVKCSGNDHISSQINTENKTDHISKDKSSNTTTSCVSLRSSKKHQHSRLTDIGNDNTVVPLVVNAMNSPLALDFQKKHNRVLASSNICSDLLMDHSKPVKSKFTGWLLRKCLFEEGGKRSSLLKRNWVRYFSKLDDLNLWFYRNENLISSIPVDCIQLHHSLSTIIGLHKKRTNVFILRLATDCLSLNAKKQLCICRQHGAEYMFQASSEEEMKHWVFLLNLSAALFSSPPLAPPVGSDIKGSTIGGHGPYVDHTFVEEGILLPGTKSNNIPMQQKDWYTNQIVALNSKLKDIDKFSSSPEDTDKFVKLIHQEIKRNGVYIDCIKEYLNSNNDVLCSGYDSRIVQPLSTYGLQPSALYALREDSSLTLSEEVQIPSNQVTSANITSPSSILKRDAVVVVSSS